MLETYLSLGPLMQFLVAFGVVFGIGVVVGVLIGVIRAVTGGGGVYSHAWLIGVGGLIAQLSINVDLQPMFDSMNTYLPTFMGLFGLIGGIVAAMQFARYIIGIVTNALSGRSSM